MNTVTARTCVYTIAYGLPHTVLCGEPAVGQWHEEDDEWFCARHMVPPFDGGIDDSDDDWIGDLDPDGED